MTAAKNAEDEAKNVEGDLTALEMSRAKWPQPKMLSVKPNVYDELIAAQNVEGEAKNVEDEMSAAQNVEGRINDHSLVCRRGKNRNRDVIKPTELKGSAISLFSFN